jgi:hypothetical protein
MPLNFIDDIEPAVRPDYIFYGLDPETPQGGLTTGREYRGGSRTCPSNPITGCPGAYKRQGDLLAAMCGERNRAPPYYPCCHPAPLEPRKPWLRPLPPAACWRYRECFCGGMNLVRRWLILSTAA